MKRDVKRAEWPKQDGEEHLELGYCPRCGVLGVHRQGPGESNCPVCARFLQWMRGEESGETAKL